MKKIILLLTTIFLLSGCGATITSQEWVWAEKVCETNSGLKTLTREFCYTRYLSDFSIALCQNGAEFEELTIRTKTKSFLLKWTQENSSDDKKKAL